MKRWLMKQLGILRKRNEAELEIIRKIDSMNLSGNEKDNIVDIVKEALDRQFE